MKIRAVNFHLLRACNANCKFCFATFRDSPGTLPLPEAMRILDLIAAEGCEKMNFAGGEPTLYRHLDDLIRHANSLGMTTSVITNGHRLEQLLRSCSDALDWVGLSVDTADEGVQVALGRSREGYDYVRRSIAHSERCRALGIRLKLNTVVTALNWEEDVHGLVEAIAPERWKVFQVLRVEGQNDGSVEPLLITSEQFDAFVERHHDLNPVTESNEAMTDSYAMIDPLGRFYGNSGGVLRESAPILEVGVAAALASVGFDSGKLEARGGVYDWAGDRPERVRLPVV